MTDFALVTAYRPSVTDEVNAEAHRCLYEFLRENDLATESDFRIDAHFKIGIDQHHETGFLITANPDKFLRLIQMAFSIGQRSILIRLGEYSPMVHRLNKPMVIVSAQEVDPVRLYKTMRSYAHSGIYNDLYVYRPGRFFRGRKRIIRSFDWLD